MPATSYLDNIPDIVRIIGEVKPRGILDLGVGNGKYSLLAREYVHEVQRVDGVEVWGPYLTPRLCALYDHILVKDMRDLTAEDVAGYDLYLMIDVIEHFTKDEAHSILGVLPGPVLVSTPKEEVYQHYDNPFEDHQSYWTTDDFRRYDVRDYPNRLSTIVLVRP